MNAIKQPATSYDLVPYFSKPNYPAHPDCLATVATLVGMTPAPLDDCRVLEIGCAAGGNLLPVALQFPRSRFVGIDLSPRQIDDGRDVKRALGADNLELRTMSLVDLDHQFGKFDYIVCHGVYSWVPAEVQDRILDVCRQHLAPQGVAYVSYNTYPGWHWRQTLRDLMLQHAARFDDPATRMEQAREILKFYRESSLQSATPFAQHMRDEVDKLLDAPDPYFFHEYLEADNRPCYFQDFVAKAQGHRLQYLGESWAHPRPQGLGAKARETLADLSADLVQYEQFFDFLCDRPFRRSVLGHEDVALDRKPDTATIAKLSATGLARPTSEAPDLYSDRVEVFETDEKSRAEMNQPLAKTLLAVLHDHWPAAVPFDALWREVRERLADHRVLTTTLDDSGRDQLAQYLLQAYLCNFVSLHRWPARFALKPGDRPYGSRLARHLLTRGAEEVPSLRHHVAKLDDFDRIVLLSLDGKRNRDDLVEHLTAEAAADRVVVQSDGERVRDKKILRRILGQSLDPSLDRLAKACLIES
jgi:methyltransferase-like protein/SAM-dependent methyltransferase